MKNKKLVFLFIFILGHLFLNAKERRIGKLDNLLWENYLNLGSNINHYKAGIDYPDMSCVGAVVSGDVYGTGTLIANNVVLTAAHILRNHLNDPVPDPSSWEFILSKDFESAPDDQKFRVESILLHSGWSKRLIANNGKGDGDKLGVDIALLFLEKNVVGVYPAKLPDNLKESVGSRIVLTGYGTLVDGLSGEFNSNNSLRTGGENILDRVVMEVDAPMVDISEKGGLIAVDFDSPDQDKNTLGESAAEVDYLGPGESSSLPLPLEASTAVGDSGGPAFLYHNNSWRVVGVLSYGTSNSTYGDVTIFTRVGSQLAWIQNFLPNWSQGRQTEYSNWLELDWFGAFFTLNNGWNFNIAHGWFYSGSTNGESFWAWQDNQLGWWWSAHGVYPYIYSYNLEQWIYVSVPESNNEQLTYYDYGLEDWLKLNTSF